MLNAIAAVDAAATSATNPRHAKLLHAAQQFEGVMLNELMKPLTQQSGLTGEEPSGGTSTMQSYGVEAMAGALAKSGALGFANRIVATVEAHEAKQS